MRDDFVALILSHGRSDRVKTYKALRKHGYTGPIRVVVDNKDKELSEYCHRFGDECIVFDKDEAAKDVDLADNFSGTDCVIFARNQCHALVKRLGFRYFVELDDDYSYFSFKFNSDLRFQSTKIKDLDAVFSAMVAFLETTRADCICMAQEGDFIGGYPGSPNSRAIYLRRKIMNTFVCDVERPFQFFGRINEDTTAYALGGLQGKLFFTINFASVAQAQTQQSAGGLTDVYRRLGTYVKSFYSVMYCPSAVIVKDMGNTDRRIHHKVSFNNCAPKLISEKWRKG